MTRRPKDLSNSAFNYLGGDRARATRDFAMRGRSSFGRASTGCTQLQGRIRMRSEIIDTITAGHNAGLSLIPIRGDGSKRPALDSWKQYQQRRPTPAELRDWFAGGQYTGVAVVGGAV